MKTTLTRVLPSGTHYLGESTKAMKIKCLVQGHNISMQSRIQPSNSASINQIIIIKCDLNNDDFM